ncbi:MAG: cytidine deaminase [Clostridia bacterium]|nr:cytidine deaminase [Clostridia bacterium]
MINQELLNKAKEVSYNSYSPSSEFCVGAALLTKSGKIYTGCNIENHGIQSICAERVAFTKAFSEGEPSNNRDNYIAIMIVGHTKNSNDFIRTLPCGYCRQFMSEFVNPNFKIMTCIENEIEEYSFAQLLPMGFEFNSKKE